MAPTKIQAFRNAVFPNKSVNNGAVQTVPPEKKTTAADQGFYTSPPPEKYKVRFDTGSPWTIISKIACFFLVFGLMIGGGAIGHYVSYHSDDAGAIVIGALIGLGIGLVVVSGQMMLVDMVDNIADTKQYIKSIREILLDVQTNTKARDGRDEKQMGKTVTVRARIPVTAEWHCSKCEGYNKEPHVLEIRGMANGGLLEDNAVLRNQAEKDCRENGKKMFSAFRQNDYFQAKMKVSCRYCKHKEVWASYPYLPEPISLILCLSSIVLCIVLLVRKNEFEESFTKMISVGALAVAVCLFEYAYNAVVRLIWKSRIEKLPERNKPTIIVNGVAGMEEFLADTLSAEHPRIIFKKIDLTPS